MSFSTPRPIQITFDDRKVEDMRTLLRLSHFPDEPPIPTKTPWDLGVDYSYLKSLKTEFENRWSMKDLERTVNRHDNFLVHYEDGPDALELHYLHVKSIRNDAIPLILLHGWPGTFFDFHKIIDDLVNPPSDSIRAFNVVVPSLPGYFLSTLPKREGWTFVESARLLRGLMVHVLGYQKFVGQGGDWGSYTLRAMGNLFPESLLAMHFNMFYTPSAPGVRHESYSEVETRLLSRRDEFNSSGRGYVDIQRTKPFTIGLAIGSSPLAILTYIGEKIYTWSDPKFVDPHDILKTVALYYLSGSFASSVLIYHQSWKVTMEMAFEINKWALKGRIGYSAFPYEINGSPRADIAEVGPLAYYKEHSHGGHFPALDSSAELLEDLREFFGTHWEWLQ